MRYLSIIIGIALLLVAGGGVVCWVTDFKAHRQILFGVSSVSVNLEGRRIEIPGRLVVALVIGIPIVCAVGGVWLLRSGLDRET
jgi:H+/Cl- antiporter ClcA